MEVKINNVGMLRNAQIELPGLSVITGANNSGKSTVSKVLYGIYFSLNDIQRNFSNYVTDSVSKDLQQLFLAIDADSFGKLRALLFNNDIHGVKEMLPLLSEKAKQLPQDEMHRALKNLENILEKLKLYEDDEKFTQYVVQTSLNQEFSGQINNLFSSEPAEIKISENEMMQISLKLSDNQIEESDFLKHKVAFQDATFIDGSLTQIGPWPRGLFSLNRSSLITGHREDLLRKILEPNENENIVDRYFGKETEEKINSYFKRILTGSFDKKGSQGINYVIDGKRIKYSNLATGIKMFSVLKLLFDNGHICAGKLLIIDEPEIHLHPEWQVILAELLVVMCKEVEVVLLLTSHSPYFIEAIDVFGKKHGYNSKIRFYKTERIGEEAITVDVTKKLEGVFKTMFRPFQELESMAAELDNNDGE